MHTVTVDRLSTMLNERGTATNRRTEPKILFGSWPVESNIRMDFTKEVAVSDPLPDEHLLCLDGGLGMSVTLWEMWRRLDMGDLSTAAEFSKMASCEFWSIICVHNVRDVKRRNPLCK